MKKSVFAGGIPFYIRTETSERVLELLNEETIEKRRAIVIFEPPGSGKTSLARNCAKKVGKYIVLNPKSLGDLQSVLNISNVCCSNLKVPKMITREIFENIFCYFFSYLLLQQLQESDLDLDPNDFKGFNPIDYSIGYSEFKLEICRILGKSETSFVIHVDEIQSFSIENEPFLRKRHNEELKRDELKNYYLINISKVFADIQHRKLGVIFTGTSYLSLECLEFGTLFKSERVRIEWDIETTKKILNDGFNLLKILVDDEVMAFLVDKCQGNGRSIEYVLVEIEGVKKPIQLEEAKRCVGLALQQFKILYNGGFTGLERRIFRADIIILFLFYRVFSGIYDGNDHFTFPVKSVPEGILKYGESGFIRIVNFDAELNNVTLSFPRGFVWEYFMEFLLKYPKYHLKELFIRFKENYRSDKLPGYAFQFALSLEMCSPLSNLYNKVISLLEIGGDTPVNPSRKINSCGIIEYSMKTNRIHELPSFDNKIHEVRDFGTKKKVDVGVPLYGENGIEIKTYWELKNYAKSEKPKTELLKECAKFFREDFGSDDANSQPRIFATPQDFSNYIPRNRPLKQGEEEHSDEEDSDEEDSDEEETPKHKKLNSHDSQKLIKEKIKERGSIENVEFNKYVVLEGNDLIDSCSLPIKHLYSTPESKDYYTQKALFRKNPIINSLYEKVEKDENDGEDRKRKREEKVEKRKEIESEIKRRKISDMKEGSKDDLSRRIKDVSKVKIYFGQKVEYFLNGDWFRIEEEFNEDKLKVLLEKDFEKSEKSSTPDLDTYFRKADF